jgi:uncharacterized protein with HEPN domain
MLQYAREARAMAEGVDARTFQQDRKLQLALTYAVQIIGEAAGRVSEAGRVALPELPWEQMRGMRHRLVHDYGRVKYEVVWDVVQNDLPNVIAALEKLTPPEPPSA